ncbi:hypothetical protein L1987_49340 [Smallanthus sonchifolius]|uniref:Uncharacterized protein n=1 Tax=Smallanthus sonchifolius TaxID=185202 RepID=A0ACB9FV28_9ASTR|nr:hypothetical protein L1987_49340 [Smallanthus sonchifolius]
MDLLPTGLSASLQTSNKLWVRRLLVNCNQQLHFLQLFHFSSSHKHLSPSLHLLFTSPKSTSTLCIHN